MSGFDSLTPELVLQAVAQAYGMSLESTLTPFPSYINRVYGLRDDDGRDYVTKFYRPGRWSYEAVLEEHQFLEDCREAELPVVVPIADDEGYTLQDVVAVDAEGNEDEFLFALFPKRGGRNFDAEGDDQWLRLGRLLGRLHLAARERDAENRLVLHPQKTTKAHILELTELVPPDLRSEFHDFCLQTVEKISPAFDGLEYHRIHGDCHRGNILDRSEEGLLLIDFDDMAMGPAVQDLWLLLPGRRDECNRELNLLIEGYEEFLPFTRSSLELIEPLRFMRILHYSAWCARQRYDTGFLHHFPGWGSEAYWVKELEDLKDQTRMGLSYL
ncbi:serine/threonine protein kinase [Marispirochaeta sp.]|jgi:Ser/Thr protein kinase RdoA (MazF antagonist)|uniref:serine/threonine protein kinase n=1 Tax=Marispirochaeta sp. TaxID=2038653 RepID=UPI0029C8098D|nr:serine/threonine protein kinase [Marispirochaeta sp.]